MNRARIAQVLDEARALMAGGHWTKGRNWHKGRNAYCPAGAICKVITGDPYGKGTSALVRDVADWVARFLPPERGTLQHFSDTAHSYDEIDALLARAAQEARA